jgi:hypothetical protein
MVTENKPYDFRNNCTFGIDMYILPITFAHGHLMPDEEERR